ncbi:MAG: hypothetical protein OEM98_18635 [Gammaproteobacteria bacterium]|nr:hypothetical protein [Gammaproteobacteria bacterium]
MKLDQVDWGVLRNPLILLVVSLAISGGLLSSSFYLWDKMNREHQRETSALSAVRAQYQNIDEEEKIIERYLPLYRALESKGIIGKERRLDWIDTLRQSSHRVELPNLRYVIDSQSIYQPEFLVPGGSFQIYASRMHLDLGLLHEGDLEALFNDLDANANGLYTVSKCDLRRLHHQTEFVKRADATNLKAECGLRWLTIKRPRASL